MMRKFVPLLTVLLLFGVLLPLQAAPVQLDYLPGKLLVRFTHDVQLQMDGKSVTSADAELNRLLTRFDAYAFKGTYEPYIIQNEQFREFTRNDKTIFFPEATDIELVMAEFNQLSSVDEAIPDWLMPVDETCPTDDPNLASQWWINKTQAKDAWCLNTGSPEILVVAIDSGTDWDHPDYIGHLWRNEVEDPDGDVLNYQSLTADYILSGTGDDGVDNDGNGLVDDFLGYDFVASASSPNPNEDSNSIDNNPIDFNGHGTGCAGALAQVGNNGIGTAGMAYNTTLLGMRCGYENSAGNGLIITSSALQGIAYAVDKGAQVINMSYGGPQFISQVNTAMVNAWNSGALLFGAAGNDGVGSLHYPSGYDNVIAVGATNSSDARANFSNYGAWVDISAPGVGCFTGWFNDTYTSWDGTSVASPIAAGVGALVIDAFPDSSNTFWRMVVEATTDEITTDQPLGTGRVNAYKAVTQFKYPEMSIDSVAVQNAGENGFPDPGETFNVYVELSNELGWMDAENVTITVSFDNDDLTATTNDVNIGTIEDGASANNAEALIAVEVAEDAEEGVFVNMFVTVTADPNDYVIETQQRFLLGTPQVLLVDDDGGDDFETFISADLDSLGEVYFSYDVDELGASPSLATLTRQPVVIWMTGNVVDPLSEDEQNAISDALEAGIHVFLFGQTIHNQLEGTDFYADVLHATAGEGSVAFHGVDAVEGVGGPVIDDQRLVMIGGSGAGNSTGPDVVDAVAPGLVGYRYLVASGVGAPAGVFVGGEEDAKLMYLPFAFEAVSGDNNTTSREEVLHGVLNWFRGLNDVPFVGGSEKLPTEFAIESAYPNPFNPSTTLRVNVPATSQVKLAVYDVLGRQVATLVDGRMGAGRHQISWNASNVSTGIYFAVLEAQGTRQVTKLAFMK